MAHGVMTQEVRTPRWGGERGRTPASLWWVAFFVLLTALPGLVALGVGLALDEILVVSAVTFGSLCGAALLVGGCPRR